MIWILLSTLGIPFWFLAGVLMGILLIRRKFQQQPGVFAIAVRAENAAKWPRSLSHGRLVRDVLVLNRGAALLRVEIHAVDSVSELEIGEGPKKPAGAVGRLVGFDDGSRCEVAVASGDVAQLDAVASRSDVER